MNKGDYLISIFRSNKTVFSLKDLALLWHDPVTTSTRVRIHNYIKKVLYIAFVKVSTLKTGTIIVWN
jgi:hypothetical protein